MAFDRWIEAQEDQAFLVTENDGWAYLRRGPQRSRERVYILSIVPDGQAAKVYYASAPNNPWCGCISIPLAEAAPLRGLVVQQ